MKKILILLLVSFITFQSCKSKKNLYLYFNQNNIDMNKVRMGQNKPYNFRFIFSDSEINFTSDLLTNKYKIDTIPLKEIEKIRLKNYDWLNNFIKSFDHPDLIKFYENYHDLYIVEIDSSKQKAIISKVERVFYEE